MGKTMGGLKNLRTIFLGSLFAVGISAAPFADKTWVASAGLGFTVSPTLALFSPQLEYLLKPDVYTGPLLQLAVGNATLFTAAWGIRYVAPSISKLKPTLQAAAGVVFGANGPFASPIGIHALLGFGIDYQITAKLTFGSMLNANIAPPVQTFFLSWPVLVGRFVL
jgi:hypothetical protein